MNFSTPQRVIQTIRAGDRAEWTRGDNRVKINDAANCKPPLSAELAKKLGVKINVSWGELMVLLERARTQYRTAFNSSEHYFKVKLPVAPPEYQADWSEFITDTLNKIMKDSLKFFELGESRWTSTVTLGVGPTIWRDQGNKAKWCGDYVPVEDLRIPTDTTVDFENLGWFGVRHIYTPGELLKKAFADGSKWNKKAVARILKNKKEINWDYAGLNYDIETQPEKYAELVRQDGSWTVSDAMPGIPFWHFYFEDDADPDPAQQGWYMCIVPAEGTIGGPQDEFLWRSDKPIAKKRERIIQCQFGDLSAKAPFMYQAIRSLGFALLEPCHYTNLTRCRLLQHVHDNFNIWLRTTDPVEKARAQVQEFGNLGMLRSGISVVPQNERHQIDGGLVEQTMAQLKQLQNEASASYTQSIDTGTRREQTAFETSVKMQQVNSMMSGLLIKAFKYETYHYKEICRRFCLPLDQVDDEDISEFQQKCQQFGIPRQFLDVKLWEIEPVTPLGMGNPTIAQAAAQQLLGILPLLDPTAQQEAKHEIVLTITGDPRKASRWVPLGKGRGVTDGAAYAYAIFGTLMQGVPVPPKEGLPAQDQIQALLGMMAGKINMIEQTEGKANPDEVVGFNMVNDYVLGLVQQLQQDKQQKQFVKQTMDALGRLMNQVKALGERGQESRKSQDQNGDGKMAETHAKIEGLMAITAAKVHAKQVADKQKQQQKAEQFVREQRRKDAETFAQIQRDNTQAKQELAVNRLKGFKE